MGATFVFTTILEITAVLLLVWGFANEDKVIEFEDKCAWLVAAYIRKVRRNKNAKKLAQKNHNPNLRAIPHNKISKHTHHTSGEVA